MYIYISGAPAQSSVATRWSWHRPLLPNNVVVFGFFHRHRCIIPQLPLRRHPASPRPHPSSQLLRCAPSLLRSPFAECRIHSAKTLLHSAKGLPSVALGKPHSVKKVTAKAPLPSVFFRALGKVFAECQKALGKLLFSPGNHTNHPMSQVPSLAIISR